MFIIGLANHNNNYYVSTNNILVLTMTAAQWSFFKMSNVFEFLAEQPT